MKRHLLMGMIGAAVPAILAGPVRAESPLVIITGGPDDSLHNYQWKITNHHSSRIVYLEFPHYRADLFHTPTDWNQKIDNVANIGWKDRMGSCMAQPKPPYQGLPPGATAEFGMRIAKQGALPGKGRVTIRFEDGTEASIADVSLPTQPEQGSSYLALIGTGAIFVLFIVLNEWRRRKRPTVATAEEEDE